MDEYTFEIIIFIMSAVMIPAIPALIIAVYRGGHIKIIFEKIDELKEKKADKIDLEKSENKLRELELGFSKEMGRLSATLDRFESIERRIEKYFEGKK